MRLKVIRMHEGVVTFGSIGLPIRRIKLNSPSLVCVLSTTGTWTRVIICPSSTERRTFFLKPVLGTTSSRVDDISSAIVPTTLR